jgi:hypothetical protein
MNRASLLDFDYLHPKGPGDQLQTQGPVASAIVICEKSTESTAILRTDLERSTGWRVLYVESPSEGLQCASILRNRLKVVIVTTGRNSCEALNFIRQVKNASAANGTECPRVLALSLASQGPEVAVAFEKLGAHYLLRAYSEQIVDVVKKIQWQCRTKNSLPTIAIRRFAGHVAQISVKSGCGEAPIEAGPKLRELAEYLVLHSRTEHTTEMIADALGVCRQSVKEYLLRLRRAFNRACEGISIAARGEQVFWTRKISGGYVHGTSANVEIEDVDEFSHPYKEMPGGVAQSLDSRAR